MDSEVVKLALELRELNFDDSFNLFTVEIAEKDVLVDPVKELRWELSTECLHYFFSSFLLDCFNAFVVSSTDLKPAASGDELVPNV